MTEELGDECRRALLEQYKLYVEMADRVSARRTQTNAFYISLLGALLAVVSVSAALSPSSGSVYTLFVVAAGVLGVLLCLLWRVNIRSYRQLNAGKFKVIHDMEEHLPFPAYKKEWEILNRGDEPRKYLLLTTVEQWVPVALAVPYLMLLVCGLQRLADAG